MAKKYIVKRGRRLFRVITSKTLTDRVAESHNIRGNWWKFDQMPNRVRVRRV